MPELPEVETLRRALQLSLPGRRIVRTRVHQRQLRWPVPRGLERQLSEQRFSRIDRRGKYLLMHTEAGCLIGHLGMSGTFRLTAPGAEDKRRHNHVIWELDDGSHLIFNDPRRFGSLHWTAEEPRRHRLLADLGPEPLGRGFSPRYLAERCAGGRACVKAVLMNAQIVPGIGNIYACEALFEAGLDPARAAGRTGAEQLEGLVRSVRLVLRRALKDGGTSIRDFSDPSGRPGYFAQRLKVYGRAGQPCARCGNPVQNRKILGRSTFFCGRCQS